MDVPVYNAKMSTSVSDKGGISDDSQDDKCLIELCLKNDLIQENFDIKEKIGGGGSGFVYKVVSKCDRSEYALKLVPIDKLSVAQREVEALAALRHDNIIRYCCSWKIRGPQTINSDVGEEFMGNDSTSSSKSNDNQQYASMEDNDSTSSSKSNDDQQYASDEENDLLSIVFQDSSKSSSRGTNICMVIQTDIYVRTLKMLIKKELFLMNDDKRLQVSLDIVNGLEYIHNKGYMHRDLKPSNIFLDKNSRARIGDFGFAIRVQDSKYPNKSLERVKRDLTSDLGTVHYIAPEVKTSTTYTQRADLYSLGIILFEMYCKMGSEMERDKRLTNLGSMTSRIMEVTAIPKQHEIVKQTVMSLLENDPCLRINLEIVKNNLERKIQPFLPFINVNNIIKKAQSCKEQVRSVPPKPSNWVYCEQSMIGHWQRGAEGKCLKLQQKGTEGISFRPINSKKCELQRKGLQQRGTERICRRNNPKIPNIELLI